MSGEQGNKAKTAPPTPKITPGSTAAASESGNDGKDKALPSIRRLIVTFSQRLCHGKLRPEFYDQWSYIHDTTQSYCASASYYVESSGVTWSAIAACGKLLMFTGLISAMFAVIIGTTTADRRLPSCIVALYSTATVIHLVGIAEISYKGKTTVSFIVLHVLLMVPASFFLSFVTIALSWTRCNKTETKFFAICVALAGAPIGAIVAPGAVERLCLRIGLEATNWVLVAIGAVTMLFSNMIVWIEAVQ
ncbi:hypothetical protein HOY82DRAFT_534884 [Tuber indicum]|nr:hypothetical protein HOY82DRAFT_534884 [Tuber indicum]